MTFLSSQISLTPIVAHAKLFDDQASSRKILNSRTGTTTPRATPACYAG